MKKEVIPYKAIKVLESALEQIRELEPTTEEIEEYGKDWVYGVVTYTKDTGYFSPHLHNTWRKKWGGRVHIDIGSAGVHLMLDKHAAWGFINFIKDGRKTDLGGLSNED